jgi:hypothetical protein
MPAQQLTRGWSAIKIRLLAELAVPPCRRGFYQQNSTAQGTVVQLVTIGKAGILAPLCGNPPPWRRQLSHGGDCSE